MRRVGLSVGALLYVVLIGQNWGTYAGALMLNAIWRSE